MKKSSNIACSASVMGGNGVYEVLPGLLAYQTFFSSR